MMCVRHDVSLCVAMRDYVNVCRYVSLCVCTHVHFYTYYVSLRVFASSWIICVIVCHCVFVCHYVSLCLRTRMHIYNYYVSLRARSEMYDNMHFIMCNPINNHEPMHR